jgi:hypothetical protein
MNFFKVLVLVMFFPKHVNMLLLKEKIAGISSLFLIKFPKLDIEMYNLALKILKW